MVRFTPQKVLRRQVAIYPLFGLIAIAVLWAYWAFAAFSGDAASPAGMPPSTRLIMAAVGTILICIGVAYRVSKTLALISRGKVGQAKLTKFGGATTQGRQSATFAYIVDGRPYSFTTSVRVNVLEQYALNMLVPIIYDSAKPSRCQVFPSHKVGIDSDEPGLRETASATVTKYIFGGLAISQFFLLFLLLRSLGEAYESGIGPAALGVVAITWLEIRLYDIWSGRATPAYKARVKFIDKVAIVLAGVAVIWTPLAIRSAIDDQLEAQHRDEQNAANRAIVAQQSQDMAQSIQILQDKIAQQQHVQPASP